MGSSISLGSENPESGKLDRVAQALHLAFPKAKDLEGEKGIAKGSMMRAAFLDLLEAASVKEHSDIALALADKGTKELPKGVYHTSRELGSHVVRCSYIAQSWRLNADAAKAMDALMAHLMGR